MIQAATKVATEAGTTLISAEATSRLWRYEARGISDRVAEALGLSRNPITGKITSPDEIRYYKSIQSAWTKHFKEDRQKETNMPVGGKKYPNYFATKKGEDKGLFLADGVTKENFNSLAWWNLMENNLGLRGRLIFHADTIIKYVEDNSKSFDSLNSFEAHIILSFHILIVLQEISTISSSVALNQRLGEEKEFFEEVRVQCRFEESRTSSKMHSMLTETIIFFGVIDEKLRPSLSKSMPLENDLEVLWQDIYKYLRDAFRNRSYRTGANTKLDQALEAIVPPHVFKKEEAEQNITYSSGNGTVGETKAIDYDAQPCLLVDHSSGPPKKNLDSLVVSHRNEEKQRKNSVLAKSSAARKSLHNTCKSAWNRARNYHENLWLGESGLVGNSDAQMIKNTIELIGEIPRILDVFRKIHDVDVKIGNVFVNLFIEKKTIWIYKYLKNIQSELRSNLQRLDTSMRDIFCEVSRAGAAKSHFGGGVQDYQILNKKMLDTTTRILKKCEEEINRLSNYDFSEVREKVRSNIRDIQSFQGKFSNLFPNTMQTHTTSSTWMSPQSRRQVTYQGQDVQSGPQIELLEDEPYHEPVPSQRHVAMRPFVANDASREHVAPSLDVKSHQQIKPWRGREVLVLVLCAVPVAASVAYAICGEWLFQLYWPLLLAGGLSFLFLALIGCMVIDHRSSRLSAHQPMLDLGNTRNAYASEERPLEFAKIPFRVSNRDSDRASNSTQLGTVPPSDDILPGGRPSLATGRTLSIDSALSVESEEHTSRMFPPRQLADSDNSGNTLNSAFFPQRTNVNHRHSGEDNAAEDKADELSKFFLGPDAQSMP